MRTLFGRETTLEELGAAVARSADGACSISYVEGHPGIGKTTLLGAVGGLAEGRGLRVLSARGEELEREFSFGVARQLFEGLLAAASEAESAALLAGPASLAGVAIGLSGEREDGAHPDSPFPTLHGLYWLTANVAAAGPVLLLIDDAQWADPSSLRFLEYLAARIEGLAVSVVIAARPGEAVGAGEDSVAELLVRIRSRAGSGFVHLDPLSSAATAAILGEHLGREPEPGFAASCHRASAGNPFFLAALVEEMRIDEVEPEDEAAKLISEIGPQTIAHSLKLRLAGMPAPVGPVTEAVAVLDARAELRHVTALAELPAAEVAAAVDALTAANVLADERPLRFIHPIVRQSVYAELTSGRRARLHAAAARVLREERQPPARVAPHLLLAEPEGDSAAVASLREAAAAALAQGVADQAQTYLERALSEPPEAAVFAEVRGELGLATAAVGRRLAEASRHLEEAARLSARPDRSAFWTDAAARVRLFGGEFPAAAQLLALQLDSLRGRDRELELRLLAHEAALGILQPPVAAQAVAELEQHVELAGTSAGELAVLAELAGKRWLEGRIGEGAELARRALAGGRLLAAEGPASVAFNHANAVLIDADRQGEALAEVDAALALAREQGSLIGIASMVGLRVVAAWKRGGVADVLAETQSLFELTEASDTSVFDPTHHAYRASALIEQGDLAAAEEALIRGGCGPELPRTTYMAVPFVARARLRLAQGRPEEAMADLLELRERHESLGVRHLSTPWGQVGVQAALALGERERAVAFAEELQALTERWDTASARGLALAALGNASGGGEGVGLLEQGVELLGRSPARLKQARALVDLGALMRREGSRAAAREPLRQGLDLAHVCGATALVARAQEELATAGAKPRRLQFSGVGSLTASERRVADLAAAGQSNREIAAALYLSLRTVENHLSRSYRKLGIGSREELPAALDIRPFAENMSGEHS